MYWFMSANQGQTPNDPTTAWQRPPLSIARTGARHNSSLCDYRLISGNYGAHTKGMADLLRKIIDVAMFGSTESSELQALDEERKFMLKQYQLGLIPETDWRELLDNDPVLSAHLSGRGVR
ncbi:MULTISPECIES: hypothetical protein [Ensifer]|uniref:Uncharacterized protein n=1 Tax=Ensifer canadensis TaxID=555315 RepID=A0AAW4FX51_9HYPH|nr:MULTISPECIES: hypothetical protein [Ensifer]MBM3095967.1 hypothetical protein [Ensifer canadensis]UBI79136.1 hypothetical protein J3R84_23870 [Ensifer canadensis]